MGNRSLGEELTYRKRCKECHRSFESDRRTRKFCSHWCYEIYLSHRSKIPGSWGINRRKQLIATGVYGKQQIMQFARFLNSTDAPQTEKEVLLADLILETRESRSILAQASRNLRKTKAGKLALSKARIELSRTPGIKPRGIEHWCKECGATQVSKHGELCGRCRDARYAVEVPEIPDVGTDPMLDLRKKDRSEDW